MSLSHGLLLALVALGILLVGIVLMVILWSWRRALRRHQRSVERVEKLVGIAIEWVPGQDVSQDEELMAILEQMQAEACKSLTDEELQA